MCGWVLESLGGTVALVTTVVMAALVLMVPAMVVTVTVSRTLCVDLPNLSYLSVGMLLEICPSGLLMSVGRLSVLGWLVVGVFVSLAVSVFGVTKTGVWSPIAVVQMTHTVKAQVDIR